MTPPPYQRGCGFYGSFVWITRQGSLQAYHQKLHCLLRKCDKIFCTHKGHRSYISHMMSPAVCCTYTVQSPQSCFRVQCLSMAFEEAQTRKKLLCEILPPPSKKQNRSTKSLFILSCAREVGSPTNPPKWCPVKWRGHGLEFVCSFSHKWYSPIRSACIFCCVELCINLGTWCAWHATIYFVELNFSWWYFFREMFFFLWLSFTDSPYLAQS